MRRGEYESTLEFLEQVVLQEVRRLTQFANKYENDFVKTIIGHSAKAAENERMRKQRELDGLRDAIFEH